MALVPYTNTTTRYQHVAGKTIKPGETRMLDAGLLPTSTPAPEPEPEPEQSGLALSEIQAMSVKDMREHLAALDLDELTMLGELEAASESPRTTALEAIQEALDQIQA